jgi:hypothetical protein
MSAVPGIMLTYSFDSILHTCTVWRGYLVAGGRQASEVAA